MNTATPKEPPLGKRVLLFAAPIAALCIAAAAMLLPAGIVRLAAVGLLALPILFLAFDRPALLFYLFVLIQFSNLDLFVEFRVYRLILILILFALGLDLCNGRRLVWHHPALLALVVVFAIVLFQSISIARDYDAAISQTLKQYKNFVAVAIALQFVRTRREFRNYILVVSVAILLTDLAPLVLSPPERLNSLSFIWEQGVFRYEGFVFEPNAFAMLQLLLLPLLMYLIAVWRRRPAIVALLSLAMLAVVVLLIMSFSRGGFVGLAALFVLLIVLERRNKAVIAIAAILIVVGLILAPGIYWRRIASMISFAQGSRFDLAIYTRIETMKEAVRLGFANPLLGVGANNFMRALGSRLPYEMIVHNTFLQIFAELGIVAFAAFSGIVAYNVAIIRSLMHRHDEEAAQIGRLLLMQLVAVFVSAFFIPVAYDYYFWYLLAFPALADYCYRAVPEGGGATPPAARAGGNTPAA